MAVEIQVPFTLDVSGQIATTSNPVEITQQHVSSLISTNPGERVMKPAYGIPVIDYLFQPGENIVDQILVLDIRAAMQTWEPTVQVTSIVPVPDDQLGIAEVDVTWAYSQSVANSTQQAVINVGGSVVPLPQT